VKIDESPTLSDGVSYPSVFDAARNASCKLRAEVLVDEVTGETDVVYLPAHPVGPSVVRKEKGVYLEILPEAKSLFDEKYEGMRVRVVNSESTARPIATIDFLLYLVQEAKDEDGQWWPIERLDEVGICTFSSFSVALGPESYWELVVPRYEGPFKTKLRFFLAVDEGEYVYSEEFDGSVNPAQLIRRSSGVRRFPDPRPLFTMPIDGGR
jgi:hypothetical protein